MAESLRQNFIWWVIPGLLAGMPMPFLHPERRLNQGGALHEFNDDLPALYASGIRGITCLLNIATDAAIYSSAGFAFQCLPVPDGFPPSIEQAQMFIHFVNDHRARNQAVAVHCEAGLGRTGTMLALYLVAQGATPVEAISAVRRVEGSSIETARQVEFVHQFPRVLGEWSSGPS